MDCTGLKRWSTSQLIDGGIAYTKERQVSTIKFICILINSDETAVMSSPFCVQVIR